MTHNVAPITKTEFRELHQKAMRECISISTKMASLNRECMEDIDEYHKMVEALSNVPQDMRYNTLLLGYIGAVAEKLYTRADYMFLQLKMKAEGLD